MSKKYVIMRALTLCNGCVLFCIKFYQELANCNKFGKIRGFITQIRKVFYEIQFKNAEYGVGI